MFPCRWIQKIVSYDHITKKAPLMDLLATIPDTFSSCFEYVSNNANSILGNKIAYFREKYRIQYDFLNLNKAI